MTRSARRRGTKQRRARDELQGPRQADTAGPARGFAIDGHSAARTVSPYTNHATGDYVPLIDALRDDQLELIGWLGERGYAVNFK
jgi:hypothetical protein